MSQRYFIEERREWLSQGRAILTGAEATHVTRVMRTKLGDEILLFDGSGVEYVGRVEKIGRSEVECAVVASRTLDHEPTVDLTMAVALPKGDRQKWLIEKLTELGVRRFIPLAAERADVRVDENVLERLRRQVIEASKQSGRLRLMEILPEASCGELERRFGAESGENLRKILLHPLLDGMFGQRSFGGLVSESLRGSLRAEKFLLAIGPVGGFTDTEVGSAVVAGWMTLDLGRQVYRVETAAVVAASLFLHWEG